MVEEFIAYCASEKNNLPHKCTAQNTFFSTSAYLEGNPFTKFSPHREKMEYRNYSSGGKSMRDQETSPETFTPLTLFHQSIRFVAGIL